MYLIVLFFPLINAFISLNRKVASIKLSIIGSIINLLISIVIFYEVFFQSSEITVN